MKTLLILRHAKSSWSKPGLADIDRPLNKRGKSDAPRVGSAIRKADLVPDLIISSPAIRARKTAVAVAEACGYEGEIEINDDFYPGDPESYIKTLQSLPDDTQSVMVVGHNPGLEELLETLTGESAALPTAALAQVRFPISNWLEVNDEPLGVLVNLWRVREL
jgi:phosphohistidine phosphatase